jgi:hypothetical protein
MSLSLTSSSWVQKRMTFSESGEYKTLYLVSRFIFYIFCESFIQKVCIELYWTLDLLLHSIEKSKNRTEKGTIHLNLGIKFYEVCIKDFSLLSPPPPPLSFFFPSNYWAVELWSCGENKFNWAKKDQLTVIHIYFPICTPIEKIVDHVDHVLEHQQTIRLRAIIKVLKSEVLNLNTGETNSKYLMYQVIF